MSAVREFVIPVALYNIYILFTHDSDGETWINVRIQSRTCPKQVKAWENLLLKGVT